MCLSVEADGNTSVPRDKTAGGQAPLHIVFGEAAADNLREDLAEAGLDERVLQLPEVLSLGPIDPPEPGFRKAWVEKELGFDATYTDEHWDAVHAAGAAFWAEATSSGVRPVVWISRRVAREYAGFLEFVWRISDQSCEVIDLTDVLVADDDGEGRPWPPRRAIPGLLDPGQLLKAGLSVGTQPLTPEMRSYYRGMWRQLRTENAALRITDGENLVSAPIDYFDDLIVSAATSDWAKMAFVVGSVLAEAYDTALYQVGDIVLAARVRALIASGRLDARGDPAVMRECWVRRPAEMTG